MAVSLEHGGQVPADQDYYDLGSHTRPITTKSHDAQVWFNRGLVWAYSFNHRESAACFEQVIAHDPTCAIGYWGVAFALGPNYNKGWRIFDPKDLTTSIRKCHAMARKAKEYAKSASPAEQALIDAIQARFPTDTVPDKFKPSVIAYANAMMEVYRRFGGNDLDIVTLAADALMGVAPWKLYKARTGEPDLSTPVLQLRDILERGLAHPGARYHPGLLHMYIHLVEMSKTPERALIAADYLRDLVPDGGHIHHMPSHIDVLVGDYRRALNTNLKATIVDEKYVAREGVENFYSFYRMHNYHSLIYAAMMSGRAAISLEATTRMEASLTERLLQLDSPPMADWLEFFNSVRVHVLIRFGMWEELKVLPVPEDKDLYCVTVALVYYGKSVAWAATGDVMKADEERERFRAAAARVPPTRLNYPNKVLDILQVATAMLDGEIEYRKGNYQAAFSSLRLAIERDDNLVYAEPWGWMLPARHPYAALLLEQGYVEEAARVYEADLGLDDSLARVIQHPNNIWALHGYHECLVRLGRDQEARIIKKQLEIAAAGADVPVKSSCFCRFEGIKSDCTAECEGVNLVKSREPRRTATMTTVVSSFAENPLTTTFSRPDDCSNIYRSGFLSVLDISETCMPEGFSTDPTFYFSPGLVCPSGYVSACHDHTGVESVTTVTCCPVYNDKVTLSCVKTTSLQSVWSTLFCTWIAPEKTSLPIVLSEDQVTSTVMQPFSSPGGLNAFGVRMVYEQSDLESVTDTGILPTNTDGGETEPVKGGDGGSSGLSQSAKIAIGVVVPVVVLALIGALFLFWRARRRQRDVAPASQSGQYAQAGQTPYGEMQQKAVNIPHAELPGTSLTPASELPADSQQSEPVELPVNSPTTEGAGRYT
ncbi:hypothetical protein jhhlp_004955 [Lomentospora prolificans]|uniref:Uncharacterized protein n=1 Tax=Lomentospora prolificans TaxID=41688 RepID=A0A2N3N7Z0_9PEZI|nr:hypothetical protein jhhlp_004955 [Lomentospora prolificans]